MPDSNPSPYNEAGQSTSPTVRFPFPVDALERYLLDRKLPGFVPPLSVSSFAMGQSNPTVMLTGGDGARFVMRRKPPGKLVSATAHQIEREFRILRALNANAPGFPVPTAYLIEEGEEAIGQAFYVMSFVQGRIFADPRLWSVQSAKDKEELWVDAARTLARLHRLKPKDLGLDNLSAPGSGFYPRQLKSFARLSEQQAKAIKEGGGARGVPGTGDLPRFGEMVAWLEAHVGDVPATEGVLMHGDFKFDNIVFHPTENRVVAVLDWELSTLGHPLADLAHFTQVFHLPHPHGVVHPPPGSPDPHIPPLPRVLAAYAAEAGTSIPYPIPGWRFAVAFGMYRRSVISQGIEARRVRGQANSEVAEARGWGMAEVWSTAGWDVVEGRTDVERVEGEGKGKL
ncbi:kinase-like domain-containing protein [Hyaloraphidium curvatum]|nr:kinase-like domain-containing protein [Hyaloraphidium curvatum]